MKRRKKLKRFLSIFLIALLMIPTGWIPVVAETSITSDDQNNIVFHETFPDGLGVATAAGNAKLAHMEKEFPGNENGKAVYVSERTNNYDGIDISFSSLNMVDGNTYKIMIMGFVDEGEVVPQGSQAFLQIPSGTYPLLANVDYVPGEPFVLEVEYTIDTEVGNTLRIQSSDEGKEVPFYIGEIIITGEGEESPPADEVIAYYETFEDGRGVARESGSATIEHVTDKAFAGNEDGAAIYVSNRSDDWHAADFFYSDTGVEIGKTYEITVTIYVEDDIEIPAGSQAIVQPVAEGAWGDWISNVDYQAGESLVLSGEFTAESDHDRIRVQSNSNGATVPFYIGEILIVEVVTDDEPGDSDDEFIPFVIAEFTFEDSEQGFGSNGTATVSRTNEDSYEGDYSLKVTDRGGEDWHGARIELTDHIYNEATYKITGYVKAITNIDEPTQFKATVANDSYTTFADINIETNEWTKFEGTFINHDNLESIPVYFESANTDLSFYLDSIVFEIVAPGSDEDIIRPPAKEFTFIDFEDGDPNGFEGRGDDDTVTVTDEANHTEGGQYALKSENRTANWNGPSLEVTDYINVGSEYEISVWVKAADQSATLQLSTQVGDGSGAAYNNIVSASVTPEDGWVLLEGTYRYASLGGGYVSIYVESNNLADFYIDDVNFKELDSEPIEVDLDLPALKEVYQDKFLIGNAVSIPDFEGPRLELLNHHHNLVTAENAMKPGDLYNGTEFDFSGADRLVEKVIEENLELHGHVLLWHQQSPTWLWEDGEGNSLTREEALANMKNHIRTVMEHFEEKAGEKLISWDVVNEALDGNWDNPEDWKSNLRNTGWFQAIGDDYIYEAFKYARQVADDMGRKDLILYYNDYNDHLQPKAETMYYMIKDINEQYARENPDDERPLISGVGMQGHYTINLNPELVRQSIQRFEQLGIDIGITELDVTTITENERVEKEINRQAYVYASLFQIFKEHAASIDRVTLWGLNDASSWRSDRFPLLFDDRLRAKPAYYGVIDPDEFLANYEEEEVEKNQGYALYGTPTIDGEIDDVWSNAPILPIDRYQGAWESGATGTGQVLWDEDYLYVLFDVNDPVLDATGTQAHEQDSVEAFVNETGENMITYQDGVGQYRVNYLNETSFNPSRYSEGFISKTRITDDGYVVEMAIPWKEITPESGHTVGFELQINDAENGSRIVATAWNDLTGQGFQDPSVFGELTLVEATDEIPEEPKEIDIKPNEPTPIQPGQIVNVTAEDGQVARISISESVPADTIIEVSFVDQTEAEDAKSDDNKSLALAGQVVDVNLDLPDGFKVDESDLFTLTLTYDTSKKWVAIYRQDEETNLWERIGGTIDPETGTITVKIPHFSRYGVFEIPLDEVINDLEERINNLEGDKEELRKIIAALQGEIEELEKGQIDIDELLARIAALEARIAELESTGGSGSSGEDDGTASGEGDDDGADEGETDKDKVGVEDESDEDKTEGDGKEIPKTATNTYNWLLLGMLFILAGSIYLLVSKRKRA